MFFRVNPASTNAGSISIPRLGVPPRRINEIVLGKRGVSADTALRLARLFNVSAQFWMGLQMDYELDVVGDELAERLEREVRPYKETG